jgi:hypothetical protein
VLVSAGEKLIAEIKLLRKENEGLRGALFEEKRKRKRRKARRKGRPYFLAVRKLLARAKAQLRRKRLKFNKTHCRGQKAAEGDWARGKDSRGSRKGNKKGN